MGRERELPALLISRLWFNSRMSSCQVDGPGAIPGSRTNSYRLRVSTRPSLQNSEVAVRKHLRAARRQSAIFILGSWQTSNALALQASLCGSVTHRLHHPSLGTFEQHAGSERRMSSIGSAKEDFIVGFQAMDDRPISGK